MITFKIPKSIRRHLYTFDSFEEIPGNVIEDLRKRYENIHGQEPQVSIVVIAYNEEKLLLRNLSSLAFQKTQIPYEVVVVNNNSTDGTQKIIDSIGVKTVFEDKQGTGYARQAGLKMAKGIYHLCGDADIIYPETYVEGMHSFLKKKNVVGTYSVCSFLPKEGEFRFSLAFYEIFRDIIVKMRSVNRPELVVGAGSFGFLTSCAKKIGWRTDIKRGEDGSMLLSLREYGDVKFCLSYKVKVWSSPRTLYAHGSLGKLILNHIWRELKRVNEYFYSKKGEYKNEDVNILKK